MAMTTPFSRVHGLVAVAAASGLLLTACDSETTATADETTNAPSEEGSADQADDGEGETSSANEAEDIAEFCASAPEVTAADRERVMSVGPLPEGDPEEVPVPYIDDMESSDDFQPPNAEGPAENVPAPEFSALLCDEDAGNDARSAALSQWFEFYRYGELVGDSSLLEQLYDPDAPETGSPVEELDHLAAQGQWVDGDAMEGYLHMWQIGEDPDLPIGFLEVVVPEFTAYDDDGQVESSEEFEYTVGLEFAFDEQVGHWRLVGEREAAMGDQAFEQQSPGNGADDPNLDEADPPQMPEEAQENTPEGALAAYDHWAETFDYQIETGDESAIAQMTHPQNEPLIEFYTTLTTIYADGGHAELLSASDISDVEVYVEDVGTDDAAIIAGAADEAGWEAFDSGGNLIIREDGVQGEASVNAMIYDHDLGHWQLQESVLEEVDEVWGQAGISDPVPDLTR